MKNLNISPKLQILLLSLLPCAFTAINALLGVFLGPLGMNIFCWAMVPVLFILWFLAGIKGYRLLHRYWKALLLINWMGFFCLLFALVYYNIFPIQYSDHVFNASIWFPYGITKYFACDVIAQLFCYPFFWGFFISVNYFSSHLLGLIFVAINTLIAFILFTVGYAVGFADDKKKANGKSNAAEKKQEFTTLNR